MKKGLRAADVDALIREIQRYLAYVEAFRSSPPAPPAEREGGNEDE
jgi:hypothetical protein